MTDGVSGGDAPRADNLPLVSPTLIDGFSALSSDYDVVLCDVWGVVHNGIVAYASAADALSRVRARGAAVVLITNAPRPSPFIVKMLDGFNVPRSAYDAIISSGDVTRELLAARTGAKVFHIGPERDLTTFDGLDVTLVGLEAADIIVCTGLFDDEVETADDYLDRLALAKARALPLLCANPDIVVERGDKLIYCAGAIAKAYDDMGGQSIYCGKPYPAIYDAALAKAEAARGAPVDRARVIAIGDALHTDMAGASRCGFDALFIASGIHSAELQAVDGALPEPEALRRLFAGHAHPRGVMSRLAW